MTAAAPPPGERTEERPQGLSDKEWAERLEAHRTEHGPGSVQVRYKGDPWRESRNRPAEFLPSLATHVYRLVHPEPPAPAEPRPAHRRPRDEAEARAAGEAHVLEWRNSMGQWLDSATGSRWHKDGPEAYRVPADFAAPVLLPPGDDEPRGLIRRLAIALDDVDRGDRASALVDEASAFLAAAPVLPPGVTLPDESKRWGTLADGRPIVDGSHNVPAGWRPERVGQPADPQAGTRHGRVAERNLWAVSPPPVPPAEPRTEPVSWWEAHDRQVWAAESAWRIIDVGRTDDGIEVERVSEHGGTTLVPVAPDGTVEVLALEPSDADQGEQP